MSLLDNAIWWHVYPLGALGAPIHDRSGDDAGHRLPRLEAWLDYVVELGCAGLLLGPIFESVAHGYDTLDHFRIDARLGDDADFDHFMAACRERGLSVMLDGVFNHVAASHPRVEELAERDEHGNVQCWEGHCQLTNLDHSKPEVAQLVVDVMLHWLRRGIAGWRLDVAYDVPRSFWRKVTRRVREKFPDALFLGEVIHGDYARFVYTSKLDTVTEYELWKATWSSIRERNFWELDWTLGRHAKMCETFVPQTFIGNHDVTRVASQVGGAGAIVAAAILFTVPGMPSIYYGDEQGFRGLKGEGERHDDDLRPELPESPDGLLPYGWWMFNLYRALITLRRRNPWLARGKLEVLAKSNTAIYYKISDDTGNYLHVHLETEPRMLVIISQHDGEVFRWEGESDPP